mmetsp:Transcript_14512/g.36464  ORF Transcript_14512/g.36464 Transcript_14512/m.36464 type:complete len:94 (+) Transcript_14512:277-558(+)
MPHTSCITLRERKFSIGTKTAEDVSTLLFPTSATTPENENLVSSYLFISFRVLISVPACVDAKHDFLEITFDLGRHRERGLSGSSARLVAFGF